MQEKTFVVISDSSICVVVYQRAICFCARNSLKNMIKQLLILFLLKIKTKIAKTIPMIPEIIKNLMTQMMMWPLMEIIILLRITNTIMYEALLWMFFLEFVIHLALNLMIYHKLILIIICD